MRWAVQAIGHARAESADVLIHLGDFGYDFLPWFLDAIDQQGLTVLFVDGNHDDHDWLATQPVQANGLRRLRDNVWHLPRGFRWQWAGVRFLACGGAYSVDRQWRTLGTSWWAGETISDTDVDRCTTGGPVDVLVAHDCPAGVMIPGIDDRTTPTPFPPAALAEAAVHRQQLRRIVDAVQPWMIWHGHYHVPHVSDADLGYGTVGVVGLDCDGTDLHRNVALTDIRDLTTINNQLRREAAGRD
jgi:hypothetical protein